MPRTRQHDSSSQISITVPAITRAQLRTIINLRYFGADEASIARYVFFVGWQQLIKDGIIPPTPPSTLDVAPEGDDDGRAENGDC